MARKSHPSESSEGLRLHAYLSSRGMASRREAEAWVRKGYVQINGKPAKLGQKVIPGIDKIRIRGKDVVTSVAPTETLVVMMFKPRGVVTTVKDPEGRKTVIDLLPRKFPRLFPVGRLDLNSEGLLLLTNDGELAYQLTHPKFEIPKVYEVKIRGKLDEKKIAFLKKGVQVEGEKYRPAEVLNIREVTREGMSKYEVRIRIFEGKNHHIRKMFEAIKCHVIRLKRVEMASLALKGIPRGGYRILSPQSVAKLRESVGLGKV